MPYSDWMTRGLPIPGEGQVQTEQPMSGQGGNWKVVLELLGAARSRGGDLGIIWYLKPWSGWTIQGLGRWKEEAPAHPEKPRLWGCKLGKRLRRCGTQGSQH